MTNKQFSKNHHEELRFLLNQWDPIGVHPFKGGPQDEYNCLIKPLIELLSKGEKENQILFFLTKELFEHMGLNPAYSNPEKFAKKLINWWKGISKDSYINKSIEFKKITLGKKAKEYIKKHLLGGNLLSKHLLNNLKNFKGEIYTFIPDTLPIKNLPLNNFESQILSLNKAEKDLKIDSGKGYKVLKIPDENKKILLEIIKGELVKKSQILFLEENLARRSDTSEQKFLKNSGINFLFSDKEIYYLLEKRDSFKKIKKTIQIAFNFYPGLIAALTSVPQEEKIDKKNKEITEKLLKHLAERTEKIIISAYDGEGYLIWEKEKNQTDKKTP